MKKENLLTTSFILLLLFVPCGAKDISLKVNGLEADNKENALVVNGKINPTVQGIATNYLTSGVEKIDLIIILDASGSMQNEIDQVKGSIKDIVNTINKKRPGSLWVGLYVMEGELPCYSVFFSPGNEKNKEQIKELFNIPSDKYLLDIMSKQAWEKGPDVGFIKLSSNVQRIEKGLEFDHDSHCMVREGGSFEPWAIRTRELLDPGAGSKNILLRNGVGWRTNALKAILVISDEGADGRGGGSYDGPRNCLGCNEAIETLNKYEAYFFGLYTDKRDKFARIHMETVSAGLPVERTLTLEYSNSSNVTQRISEVLNFLVKKDDFIVYREEGPSWDNLGTPLELKDIPRDGGKETFNISYSVPSNPKNPSEYFKYRLELKDNPAIYDIAWVKVLTENYPPHAEFTAIPREGFVPLTVDFNALMSSDPDGDALAYYWSFSDRADTMSVPVFPLVFDSLEPIDVTLTVKDAGGLSDSVTKTVFLRLFFLIVRHPLLL